MNPMKFNYEVCKSKIRSSIPHLGISKVGIETLNEGLESSKTPPPRSSDHI